MGLFNTFRELFFNGGTHEANSHHSGSVSAGDGYSAHTVLAIDNDPGMLETIRNVLRDRGFNVLTSNTGPKGLDMLRYSGGGVKAVLLDYDMPHFNGAQTLQYARKLAPKAKIIAVTALDDDQLPPVFRSGVDSLIKKPFRNDELIQTLHQTLGSQLSQPSTHSTN